MSTVDHRLTVSRLTKSWGSWDSVSLYLRRCQVATPDALVEATWRHVGEFRDEVGSVVDFGAGDGRFSRYGTYSTYIGYEIDARICSTVRLAKNASLLNRCAFSDEVVNADLCIGNPPFVRNQDLPAGWREHASSVLQARTGVTISGLANAWQYFFLLALASVSDAGLCALIVPYEWVSRPSSKALRDFIAERGWRVSVYRLVDATFNSVLTTSSITIVDKSATDGQWEYFEEDADGEYQVLASPSGSSSGVIEYLRRRDTPSNGPRARRGLSPGTQKVLTLTEGERVRLGLDARRDVVPCITTLRHMPGDVSAIDLDAHKVYYRTPGKKCWLIRTDREPSEALQAYLDSVPSSAYQTSTCLGRSIWWKFDMPEVPGALISMSFRGSFPKVVRNALRVRAVGGVSGVYGANDEQVAQIVDGLGGINVRNGVVAYSHGLHKIEISQLNSLLLQAFGGSERG